MNKKIIAITLLVVLLLSGCKQKGDLQEEVSGESYNDLVMQNEQADKDDEMSKEQENMPAQNIEQPNKSEEKTPDTDSEDVAEYSVSYEDNAVQPESSTLDEASKYEIVGYIENVEYVTFNSVDELYNASDYVVVATPIQSYEKSEQFWLDSFNKPTEFSKLSRANSYSVRQFKILKVCKGEKTDLEEMLIGENVVLNEKEMKAVKGSYPTQKGEEYLLFLTRANLEREVYFPVLYQGAYNIDDSKNQTEKNIDQNMLAQVKERFKEEFK